MKLRKLLDKIMGIRPEPNTIADMLEERGYVRTESPLPVRNLVIYEKGDCRILYDTQRGVVVDSYGFE